MSNQLIIYESELRMMPDQYSNWLKEVDLNEIGMYDLL